MNTAVQYPLINNGDIVGGIIKAREGDYYWVDTDTGLKRARKAFGCLVEPRVADEVLLSILPGRGIHILSVLERRDDESADIRFSHDVRIHATNGTMGLNADHLNIASTTAEAAIGRASYAGTQLRARVNVLHVVSNYAYSAAQRLVQKLDRCYRWIEDIEDTQAGRITCKVRDTLRLEGKRAKLLADENVKIDADKINIG